jgi:hypothetical protein
LLQKISSSSRKSLTTVWLVLQVLAALVTLVSFIYNLFK